MNNNHKISFSERVKKIKPIIFDGAIGTMLIAQGINLKDNPPEILNIENPEIIKNIYKQYIDAGSEVITTNTFGANSYKLSHYNLSDKLDILCASGIKIAQEAAKNKAYVAASIGPIGRLVAPLGDLNFDEAVNLYTEVIKSFHKAQPDLIIIETMLDIQETRAALLAVKENTDIPVIVTMTFDQGLRSTTGTSPEAFAITAQSMGAFAVGANCSTGPLELTKVAKNILKVADIPVIIQANAGTPIKKDNRTIFPMEPVPYAEECRNILKEGVSIIGGCCGTTPDYIKSLNRIIENEKFVKKAIIPNNKTYLTSRTKYIEIQDYPIIVGERINPNALKKIREGIKNRDYSDILLEAETQVQSGADVLDVNVSVPQVDEPEIMEEVVLEVQKVVNVPLCIDSPLYESLEKGLRAFSGKAIVNSTNGEDKKLAKVLPLVKKYGASIVCLTMDEKGIPETVEDRVKIAEKIIKKCDKIGIPRKDIFVDTLTLAISTEPESANKSLDAIYEIKKRFGVKTFLGVSNISYGLPGREFLNSSFLSMAISRGLDAAIINPKNEHIRYSFSASSLLRGADKGAKKYLELSFNKEKKENTDKQTQDEKLNLAKAIIKGNKEKVKALLMDELKTKEPLKIISDIIVPSLDEVGKKYDKGQFFLPQLLYSAEAAGQATAYLQDQLAKSSKKEVSDAPVVIFATVKGDLHDIGKNIVISVLKNYGYKLIDIGKNIDINTLIEKAKENNARVIALSSLMTTTMNEMDIVIKRLNELGIRDKYKVIIGGAVVNEEYSKNIGADGYAKDPMDTVKLLKKLLTS